MVEHIDLAEYLFRRLTELGVRSIHGVPGDYNLSALDYLKPLGLHWVGNANELNAGYAADGYARIKGIAALLTSFGVGELSALNTIAGAYSEKAPVVHIVGTPLRAAQENKACLHHSLGDGNLRVFADIYKSVTVAQANLINPDTATAMIDATLRECILQSRPVYIELPTDMVKTKVPPPSSQIDLTIPGYDTTAEDAAVETILERIRISKQPLILVDGFAARFNAQKEINDLIRKTSFPSLTTPFGKGLIDERLPNFHGMALGLAGDELPQSWLSQCDLVLHFGPLKSDVNTFGYTALPNPEVTVTFEKYSVHFGDSGKLVHSISSQSLLGKLLKSSVTLQRLQPEPYPNNHSTPREALQCLPESSGSSPLEQKEFWLRMSEFLRPEDIILTETGTSSHGGQSLVLPEKTTLINSSIWLSIGYTLAACQGAALAQREMVEAGQKAPGRTILFEGDGSLQMTAQAISDIIKNKLDVIIFVVNNDGYTVERLIHGFYASYNDIQPWRNLEAASYFGARIGDASYPVTTGRASTWGELEAILNAPTAQLGKGLTMIEVMMDIADAPVSLKRTSEYVKRRNAGQ
ncbi:thiamine diphosphate-binding protein [Thelonectria olida]|uniref:Pyruvate decarboxylase n=1 Tax=Thelonectria olida TaxID=1576542 RepID=A0A9P8W0U2_9HYPO|nr:thiamine diphosphate-binding protein [Thelonectria olida]